MEQKTIQKPDTQVNRPSKRFKNRRNRKEKGEQKQTPVAEVEPTVTPIAPRPSKEERKNTRYELAREQTNEKIDRIKNNDMDGDMIVKTYGLSYELSKVVDSMMIIQSIQTDLANKSKRLSKSLKVEDLNALSSMIGMLKGFASDVQSIQTKIEEVSNKYLLQGIGPKKAVDDAKSRQKQKTKKTQLKAKVVAPKVPTENKEETKISVTSEAKPEETKVVTAADKKEK